MTDHQIADKIIDVVKQQKSEASLQLIEIVRPETCFSAETIVEVIDHFASKTYYS